MVSRSKSIRRKISTLGAAAFAVLALSAVAATGAQAFEWEIEGQTLVQRGLSSETTAGSGKSFEITSTAAGEEVKVSCTESSSGTIATGGTGEETLSLSSCTAVKPATCIIPPLSLKANTQLIKVGGVTYEKFLPKVAGGNFASLTLEKCAAEGKYPLKGSFAGLGGLGRLVDQPLSFSAAIGSAAGTTMTMGTQPATVSGSVERHLSGANVGKWWQRQQIIDWTVNGSQLKAGETQAFSIKGGPLTLESTLTGFNCSGVSGSASTITGGGTAKASSLNLTGCALTQPAGCSLVSSSISTGPVQAALKGIGGYMYETFTPQSGTRFFFLQVKGCALEGSYAVTGSFSGKGGKIGAEAKNQPLAFSSTIDKEVGSSMKIASYGAVLSGGWTQELSSGNPWGSIEP